MKLAFYRTGNYVVDPENIKLLFLEGVPVPIPIKVLFGLLSLGVVPFILENNPSLLYTFNCNYEDVINIFILSYNVAIN